MMTLVPVIRGHAARADMSMSKGPRQCRVARVRLELRGISAETSALCRYEHVY